MDVTGGDLAPGCNLEGALETLQAFDDVHLILTGPQAHVEAEWNAKYAPALTSDQADRIEFVDAPETISTDEAPVMALRKKRNSPFGVGMTMVRKKQADAFVSAGSTGALMAGSMVLMGRIPGIQRPAIGAILPTPERPVLLIDAGANVDCKPEWLVQFALMGSVYMQKVMGVSAPKVGLLNIGAEAEKGDERSKCAHVLLSQDHPFCFIGNVEARDAFAGACDVLVTDGFAGNTLLKNSEGVALLLFRLIKEALMSSLSGKIAGLLAKDSLRSIKKMLDPTEIGGAPLLGAEGAIIKAHGNSTGHAIFCAIRQARAMVHGDVVEQIRAGLKQLPAPEEPQTTEGENA